MNYRELITALRHHGVQVRYTTDMVLRFKPKDLPPSVLEGIRHYQHVLMMDLAPWGTTDHTVRRKGWTHGIMQTCYGCDTSTVQRDPLGQPRHYWCGWWNQARQTGLLSSATNKATKKRKGWVFG